MVLDLATLSTVERQYYLQHVIAPRPICFASTINAKGEVNLSPFSFFNLFSSQPPVVIFSPSRRVRDNTTKHTLENLKEVPEVVINMVTENMVQQTSLASCEYPAGVNEFIKAGFTQEAGNVVKPPMVKESPVKLECRVLEIKPLGTEGGAGNLVICEVLQLHIADDLLDENKKIDQRKLPLVARLGGDWYCRVNESNLFMVEKPNTRLGIGIDQLPSGIRNSKILTGNELGQLANVHEPPVVDAAYHDTHLQQIIQYYSLNPEDLEKELHLHARTLLLQGKVADAWQVLLATEPSAFGGM
ncbi:MAG: flavin reductase family protein [Terrimonas ferruginea]|jgi:flavin reductase (DIM6/NTAB) family NADH-FMN oxidoreductase RutF|uniref:flavin reductase family protein n=1 Tax=Terrimonas ferruginea TaxID=249 RepID=UPI00086D669A|nr:flavin reductase family protein [Terrimonas ferruginea]MBN8783403.1 flavin reductase family protein [Terrimonas ferruginea]ODS71898.1 MAG: flavin reductase [Cytophagaceae bacterium SCN 52-12]OJW40178.1 MAG: flavin reductase [Sphingobacteriales bacterium 48-107]